MINSSDAKLLQILSDKTRIQIITLLLQSPKFVSEINEELKIEQSLLSQHLKTLRGYGIVCSQRFGKQQKYNISPKFQNGTQSIDLGCCELSFNIGSLKKDFIKSSIRSKGE